MTDADVLSPAPARAGDQGADPERRDALRGIETEVAVLIRRVRRVIGERARAVHPSLHPVSYLILAHVREAGPVRASVLSTIFETDKGAISRQVQHLIDLGLLDRAPDPEDGRATLLSATDEARRRLDDVARERSDLLAERLGSWPVADVVDFAASLRRYNEALS